MISQWPNKIYDCMSISFLNKCCIAMLLIFRTDEFSEQPCNLWMLRLLFTYINDYQWSLIIARENIGWLTPKN